MRRTASEIIRSLEIRVARLEGRTASYNTRALPAPNPSVLRQRMGAGVTPEEREVLDALEEMGGAERASARSDWSFIRDISPHLYDKWVHQDIIRQDVEMGYEDGEMVYFDKPTTYGLSYISALIEIAG